LDLVMLDAIVLARSTLPNRLFKDFRLLAEVFQLAGQVD
jgi:hypothetical protein